MNESDFERTCIAWFQEFGYPRQVLKTLERSRGHNDPADLQAAEFEHGTPQRRSPWRDASYCV